MRIKGGGIKKFDSKIEGRVVRLESRMKEKMSNVSHCLRNCSFAAKSR